MKQIALYIHIPYCVSKCGYCDFVSYPHRGWERETYGEAVLKELDFRKGDLSGAEVPSVFFGGGTPTLLGGERLAAILDHCKASVNLAPQAEISVEANPDTVSPPLLGRLLEAGFNRISIGVQSFDDRNLRRLGRTHDSGQAALAVQQAKEEGFENISLDLMFGIPGQEPADWEEDIDGALSLSPQHISVYGLKIEEKTPYHHLLLEGLISQPPEEVLIDHYYKAVDSLSAGGYEHYEISNFARPGCRSVHNLNYWKGGQYLGLGTGAHSFLGGERSSNLRHPAEYIARVAAGGSAVEFQEQLTPREALGEAIMLELRLIDGIDMGEYSRRYGFDLHGEYAQALRELSNRDLIEMEGGRLRLTREGLIMSDEVFLRFL